MKKYCKGAVRFKQWLLYKACYFMHFREPVLLKNYDEIVSLVKRLNKTNVMLVVDPGIHKLGLSAKLIKALEDNSIKYTLFTTIEANPKIKDIEQGVVLYNESKCDMFIALGGGSAIDSAKAIAARIVRPKKSIEQLKGLLKVGRKIPPFVAIPTTAGTGSECTIASVVTNSEDNHKYAINDLNLTPHYALLDPELTLGLPKNITAWTGMDALTHAVEGYISRDVPKKCKLFAEQAIVDIINNMKEVYDNPTNIEAREKMLKASYKAGVVFTRTGLTYVHPIAHTLGGLYNVPHGLANANILPVCLRYYGSKVWYKLANLAELCELTTINMTMEEKANAFIKKIEELNDYMGVTQKFDIKDDDIDQMIDWALAEANGQYNPPVYLRSENIREIIDLIKN